MSSCLIMFEIITLILNPTNWIWCTSTQSLYLGIIGNQICLFFSVQSCPAYCIRASLACECQTPTASRYAYSDCDSQNYSRYCQISPERGKYSLVENNYVMLFSSSLKYEKWLQGAIIWTGHCNSLELPFQHLTGTNLHILPSTS